MLFVILLAVFVECTAALIFVEWMQPGAYAGAEQVVAELNRQSREPVAEGMQRNLAKWYNLNRISEKPDSGYPEKYWEILDFTNHAMGYLSVPALGLQLPIYHGTEETVQKQGVGHYPASSIPLGLPGEHTGLQFPVSLEVGAYFYIHILHQVLPYRVTDISYVSAAEPEFPPSEEAAFCTLVLEGGDRLRLTGAVLDREAPAEKEITVEYQEDSDGWLAASCLVLALGILLIPVLMWCRLES